MSQNINNPYGNNPYGGAPYPPYENQEASFRQQPQGFPPQQQGFAQQQPFPQQPAQGNVQVPQMPTAPHSSGPQVPGMLPVEESYIENILRLNKGKLVHVFTTFENNKDWNAKIFNGLIEAAGRDHLIISDPQTGKRFLIPMVYLDYITFDEEIDYEYPFGGQSLVSYPPR